MTNPKNKFSPHIFSTEAQETDAPVGDKPVKEAPDQSLKREPVSDTIQEESREQETPRPKPDYRRTRAEKKDKKPVNILIDRKLHSQLKPRMVTRNLTWENLIEGLLQKWLQENPGFEP